MRWPTYVYLVHIVGGGALAVPGDRAKSNEGLCVLPKTKEGLRSFLGSISCCRRFIPNVASYISVLTLATSLVIYARVERSFFYLCNALYLTLETLLHYIQMHHYLVLVEFHSGNELPLAYYARQLQGAEKNYAATELEVLAVVASIEHFAHYLSVS